MDDKNADKTLTGSGSVSGPTVHTGTSVASVTRGDWFIPTEDLLEFTEDMKKA
jgi:hypothetical protein